MLRVSGMGGQPLGDFLAGFRLCGWILFFYFSVSLLEGLLTGDYLLERRFSNVFSCDDRHVHGSVEQRFPTWYQRNNTTYHTDRFYFIIQTIRINLFSFFISFNSLIYFSNLILYVKTTYVVRLVKEIKRYNYLRLLRSSWAFIIFFCSINLENVGTEKRKNRLGIGYNWTIV